MFELVEKLAPNAVIKVIGVGGGGGNAVAHMVNSHIDGVDFICANTDAQALKMCGAKLTLQLGSNVTKGLGAGATAQGYLVPPPRQLVAHEGRPVRVGGPAPARHEVQDPHGPGKATPALEPG